MEPVTRKERERRAHRREILAGARSLFALKGFAEQLTVDIDCAVATIHQIFLHGAVVPVTLQNTKRTPTSRRGIR